MNSKLKSKINESLSAVLPITGIVLVLSIFLIPIEIGTAVMFFAGAFLLIVGMGMFQLGAEISMEPIGEGIGVEISKSRYLIIMCLVSFAMGLIITIAEPDLQVLSNQVPAIPNITLIFTVAVGVGIFLTVAVLRIVHRIDLSKLLMVLYTITIICSFFIPKEFLAVAFDSGGVTTGPITVPFIMALGVGLSMVRADKNASNDSFGLVALSSIGPILAVMLLGVFFRPSEATYSSSEMAVVNTTQDVANAFGMQMPHFVKEVLVALLPIFLMFIIFQLLTKRYKRTQRLRITIGFLYTYIGLVLFLCGVNVGFAPVGTMIGKSLAATSNRWLLVPIGMLIGYFIVKAEPAIQILNRQVQNITSGTISAKSMNMCLSIGVCISVGLAMLRVLTGLPLIYIIIPGYIAALVMSRFVPPIFVGIAFDSGGVASGPMTATFLLPLCIGACETVGGNIMTDAFGVVSLVALTPLIAIQIMGLAFKFKLNKIQKGFDNNGVFEFGLDDIIEF